jgi:hypothetical protein
MPGANWARRPPARNGQSSLGDDPQSERRRAVKSEKSSGSSWTPLLALQRARGRRPGRGFRTAPSVKAQISEMRVDSPAISAARRRTSAGAPSSAAINSARCPMVTAGVTRSWHIRRTASATLSASSGSFPPEVAGVFKRAPRASLGSCRYWEGGAALGQDRRRPSAGVAEGASRFVGSWPVVPLPGQSTRVANYQEYGRSPLDVRRRDWPLCTCLRLGPLWPGRRTGYGWVLRREWSRSTKPDRFDYEHPRAAAGTSRAPLPVATDRQCRFCSDRCGAGGPDRLLVLRAVVIERVAPGRRR